MTRAPRMATFVVVAPGLEPVLHAELSALRIRASARPGGASASLSTRELYVANLGLRTATRVLVRVGAPGTRVTSFADLQAAVRAVDWSPWLAPDTPVDLRVACQSSRLFHTGAVAERVIGALDRPAARDGQRVHVRIHRDALTLSVDASGEGLHRRGWRQATAKAPLRETLAAAMVLSSGWDGRAPLADPLCGSGTIAIEAALVAADRAPGLDRTFAFQRWPSFEPGTWASARGAALARIRPADHVLVVGSDRDAGAVEAARSNAERAGVADRVELAVAPLSELPATLARGADGAGTGAGASVLTNPPYGRRVRTAASGDRRDLFARLGQVATAVGAGDRLGLLVDRDAPLGSTGLDLDVRWKVSNGGVPVRFVTSGGGG